MNDLRKYINLIKSSLNEIKELPANSFPENQYLSTMNWLSKDGLNPTGDKINDFEVRMADSHNGYEKNVGLFTVNNKCIGYINLQKYPDNLGWLTDETAINPSFKYNGLIRQLYDYLIQKGFTLISAGRQTSSGRSLWEYLINSGKYDVKILMNNETFDWGAFDPWKEEYAHIMLKKKSINEENINEIELISHDAFPETVYNREMKNYSVSKFFTNTDSKIDKFDIKKRNNTFALFDNNECIAYVELREFDFGFICSQTAVNKKYRGKGLIYNLYCYLLDNNYTLISDDQQTPSSQNLWKKLINSNKYKIYIYDDVKNKVIPKENIDPWSKESYRLVAKS